MTEIPMPGDYGATQPPSQPKSEGCCSRSCKCCVYFCCGIILLIVLMVMFGVFAIQM